MPPDAVNAIYQRYKLSSVIQAIAPDDEMWLGGQSWYFSVGESGVLAVLRALAMGSLVNVETILDLPCGHGRVARHLRAAFPEASMTFCDLVPSGVEFCEKTFGGRGVLSVPDLTQVHLPGQFDVIWVGSLFTHVDLRRTEEWMKFLCRHLNDDGILVATFHGRWSIEVQRTHPLIDGGRWRRILRDFERKGYGYADYGGPVSKPGRIAEMVSSIPGVRTMWPNILKHYEPARDYGISVSKPQKIIEIVSSIHGVRILAYTERGWADNHDVLTVARTDRLKPWG